MSCVACWNAQHLHLYAMLQGQVKASAQLYLDAPHQNKDIIFILM